MSRELPVDVVEAYAFANTPAYLYRKLSTNEYVRNLENNKEEDLLKLIVSSSPENLESIALAYAALIALLRKNMDISTMLALPEVKKLEWANALQSLFIQKVPTISESKVKMPIVYNPLDPATLTPFTFKIEKAPSHD